MSWKLSRFRAGDLVEVRTRDEILATLDENGCLDGMPFMPEMLQYCGRQVRVAAVAHKTCDTAKQTWTGRRLDRAVHLEGLRCDGSAHGGCQAECNLFWRDEWLKPAGAPASEAPASRGCSLEVLQARTFQPVEGAEARYSCQATQLYDYTAPLKPWDPRQYVYDVTNRNHRLRRVLRVLWLSWLRKLAPRMPIGYTFSQRFNEWWHRTLTGRGAPRLNAGVKEGETTPTGRLDLRPGELVRVKSQQEIEKTVDRSGKNRGLSFDPEEMAPYCGKTFRVRKCVTVIIDEPTGKMIRMKQPCIMLEGVVCNAEYASCRLNCPRAIPSYWRELWLERVEQDSVRPDNTDLRCAALALVD